MTDLQQAILYDVQEVGTRGISCVGLTELYQDEDASIVETAVRDMERQGILFRNPDGRLTAKKNRFE